MRKVILTGCQDSWVYFSQATERPCDSVSLPAPHSHLGLLPPDHRGDAGGKKDDLPKVSWVSAKKDEGRGEGDTDAFHLSMLMGGRVPSKKELLRKPPNPIWFLSLSSQRDPLLPMPLAPLPGFAYLHVCPFHSFRKVLTSPKHSKDGQQVEREGSGGWGSCVVTSSGSWLSVVVLVILSSGRGIWGAQKVHDRQHFESGVRGGHCERCLLSPLKTAVLKHLKGSIGTRLFWGLNAYPVLC